MIFVSLGTQDKPFNRIIDYILKLKEEIKELEDIEIVFQIGQTKLSEEEKNNSFQYVKTRRYEKIYNKCKYCYNTCRCWNDNGMY